MGADPASSAPSSTSVTDPRKVLVAIGVPLFFTVVNASAVAVILPEIGRDLSADAGSLAWLMSGFLLVYGVSIPFYGRLAERYGARKLFLLGLAVFALGSLLSAFAQSYGMLLTARLVQALGGAAIPSLGMTLVSRAYGPERRGTAFGIVAATLGGGAALGPLLGGALSGALGWQSIFGLSTLAAAAIPFGLRVLPADEEPAHGPLDALGGLLLSVVVVGALFAATEGPQSGWEAPLVLASVVGSALAAIGLVTRHRSARSPFIPRELVENPRFLALTGISFLAMASQLGPLIGLPLLLAAAHGLSIPQIGIVLLPGAIMTGVLGIVGGRMVDSLGTRIPTRIGAVLMLVAVLGLSVYSGGPVWAISASMALLGAGFALVNTPVAAAVSLAVRPQILSSALSINSMLLFIGGSVGATLLSSVAIARAGAPSALNPLHEGPGANFSDAFLFFPVLLLAVLALSFTLPKRTEPAKAATRPAADQALVSPAWVPNCTLPWTPECEDEPAAQN